jgi:hypothetical protein
MHYPAKPRQFNIWLWLPGFAVFNNRLGAEYCVELEEKSSL